MWVECNSAVVWTFFGIAFLWDWSENWPFPVPWSLLSFPDLLAYWVQHFHSIIFRIWNSSAGIASPPLALFVVMVPKSHLTLHSRMSGSRWVITPSWLCHVQFFVTPWTVAHQFPLYMGFSSKITGVCCHFLLQGIFLAQGSNLYHL